MAGKYQGEFVMNSICIIDTSVSLGEGMLMNGLLKSVARQPDIISELRSLMILGVAFIEGTFFVTLVFSFIIK